MSLGDKNDLTKDLLELLFPTPVASMIVLYTFTDEIESLHFCKGLFAWMKKVRSYRGRKRDDKIVEAVISIEHIREWIEIDNIGEIIAHTKAADITPQLLISYCGFCRNPPEDCADQIIHMMEVRDYLMDRYDPHGVVADFIAGKKNVSGSWARGTYTPFHSRQGYGKPERRVRKAHGRNNTWNRGED